MKERLQKICNKYYIFAFVLFGSQATGKANKLSDFDLAYLPQKKMSQKQENALYLDISRLFKTDAVDLLDLTKADIVLKYAVINGGKILVSTDERALCRFVFKARQEYLDTMHIRNILAGYMQKRILAGKFGG